jgi:hypothetical protein
VSTSFEIANGVTVRVAPPTVPAIRMGPPPSATVLVVPVPGPTGPKGDPGDSDVTTLIAAVAANQAAIEAMQTRGLDDLSDVTAPPAAIGVLTRSDPGATAQFRPRGHHHEQVVPVLTWLITHDLPFTPSGVEAHGADGRRLYPQRVVNPAIGRTRLEFTRPASGTADLF